MDPPEQHGPGRGSPSRPLLRHVLVGAAVALPAAALAIGVAVPPGRGWLLVALAAALLQAANLHALRRLHTRDHHATRTTLLRGALSRYVPASVVDELEAGGADVELGGEECEITVMFVDVRRFTEWSEQLDPHDVLEQLNELMHELSDAVFETEGTLDKFTGDGLMAFWGAPVHQQDHADRACRTALGMLARVRACNELRVARGLPSLTIGIGIHSGPALVGNVGHRDRHDYTAIGDTVNTGARIEAATKDIGAYVLVSGRTREYLQEEFLQEAMRRVGEVGMRGKKRPVEIWILGGDIPQSVDEDVRPAA